jgi:predicted PolB exonuclease-like 3'-5' exonuclease
VNDCLIIRQRIWIVQLDGRPAACEIRYPWRLAAGWRVPKKEAKFLVFDVESVADGLLVSRIRYPDKNYDADTAIDRYRQELLDKYESDFIPYTYQIPVAVAIAKVSEKYRLLDVVSLDEPEFRPHVITEHFWRGWYKYGMPTLVSFNGRTFDIPLLELAAFRYGISVPAWFNFGDRAYDQKRNRYNQSAHFDLHDVLTNFGATRFSGGLNLVASLLGKPGKMDVAGHMVQDLYAAGELGKINDYCRCDVLDTYFIFLRQAVLTGQLTLDEEQELVAQTREWLQKRADDHPAFEQYLDQWSSWQNPWPADDAGKKKPASRS